MSLILTVAFNSHSEKNLLSNKEALSLLNKTLEKFIKADLKLMTSSNKKQFYFYVAFPKYTPIESAKFLLSVVFQTLNLESHYSLSIKQFHEQALFEDISDIFSADLLSGFTPTHTTEHKGAKGPIKPHRFFDKHQAPSKTTAVIPNIDFCLYRLWALKLIGLENARQIHAIYEHLKPTPILDPDNFSNVELNRKIIAENILEGLDIPKELAQILNNPIALAAIHCKYIHVKQLQANLNWPLWPVVFTPGGFKKLKEQPGWLQRMLKIELPDKSKFESEHDYFTAIQATMLQELSKLQFKSSVSSASNLKSPLS